MAKPRASSKNQPRPEKPGDDIRRVAEEALRQTTLLEEALDQDSVEKARDALEKGALPRLATFSGKSGKPTISAVAKALQQPSGGLELVELLLEYDAPLPTSGLGAVLEMALRYDRVEALPVLVKHVNPRVWDWSTAITRPTATFLALDALVPMDRKKNLGNQGATGSPPLFFVWDMALMRYLVQTGADPLQTPGLYAKNPKPEWAERTIITNAVELWSQQWRNNKRVDLAEMIQYFHECGVPLTEKDFQIAIEKREMPTLKYFIQHGFKMTLKGPLDDQMLELRAYQTALDLEQATKEGSAQGGSRRL